MAMVDNCCYPYYSFLMASAQDDTTTMNVSMPQAMRTFVSDRITGRFGNTSEYIRDLIRRDQKEAAKEELEKLLLEGVRSGESVEVTPDDWAEIRDEVRQRIEAKKTAR